MTARRRPFLTASWQHLLLVNYACPQSLLLPLVPAGTTLDTWQGEALISVVGFMFDDTRVVGVAWPGHRTFEEVNLRFYVRREMAGEPPRRGVVFIRELVPRWLVAFGARAFYDEPYVAQPMSHDIAIDADLGGHVEYAWGRSTGHCRLAATVRGKARDLVPGSEAEFITEHYWGYTRRRDGRTSEYEVTHPRWRVWEAADVRFDGNPEAVYGPAFSAVVRGVPRSAFVALGSPVSVFPGHHITTAP